VADPVLTTARLTLRPLAYADLPALFAAIDASRSALEAWLPWAEGVRSPDDLRVFVDRTMRENADGAGHRAFFDAGMLAGHISLESVDHGNRAAELGYWIRTDRAGRGLTTEAARALLAWGFRHLDLHRVTAYTDAANAASARVLDKCGFRREGLVRQRTRAPGGWRDDVLHGLLRGELRDR
jgi:RimJ/RimL family protein N-acetyltransferase